MNAKPISTYRILGIITLLLSGATSFAQVPVDDNGNTVGNWANQDNTPATGNEGIPLQTRQDLQGLVGPVALYPDDLLAVVLPAATYPLQIVQAARFLEDLKSDPTLKPDEDWDESVVALLNYPEVIALLNEDLDWTWQLGEAVVAQQADVVNAVEDFRNTAYAAGNLQSDGYQNVSRAEGVIEISPVNDDVIYVPYYEPERVVVYQPTPVYHYYERPRPVYYYPYPASHAFNRGLFWGVTTAFTIGWATDNLNVYHQSYSGHPYYGYRYSDNWWYRRPSIQSHNSIYSNGHANVASRRATQGDYWRPSRNTRLHARNQRITSNSAYGGQEHNGRGYRNNRNYSNHAYSNNAYSTNSRRTNSRVTNSRAARSSNNHNTQQRRAANQQGHGAIARDRATQRPARRSTDLRPQQTHENRNDRRRSAGSNSQRQPRNVERQARSNHDRAQPNRSNRSNRESSNRQSSNRERSNRETRDQERTAARGNSRSRNESRRRRH